MTTNTMLTRASLIELHRARKVAKRCSNTSLVHTLNNEIARRLGTR